MSVVPWQQLNPADSPYVKMFGLVGILLQQVLLTLLYLQLQPLLVIVIFANSRTMFGLAGRKQGPAFLHRTNKHGVPHYAILVTWL